MGVLLTIGKPKKFSTCWDENVCKGEYSMPILLWIKLFDWLLGFINGLGIFIELYCDITEDLRIFDSALLVGFTSSCKIPAVLKSSWIPSPYSTWMRVLWLVVCFFETVFSLT